MRFMVNITLLSYDGMTVGCILEVGGPIIHRLHSQCCMFMFTDVSRTSDCVSGDMISRHKVRITWVGKRARHRGLSHDYLGIGVRCLRVNAFLWRLGGIVSLNIRCRSVNYFIITSFSSLSFLRSYAYSHIFVPPCCLLFSLHHRLRFILHF